MNRGLAKAFTGVGAEARAERVGHWLKSLAGNSESRTWCVAHRVPVTRATGESVNQVGGFLAPIDFDDAIIAVRDTVGAFRNAEVRPSRSDNRVRPRRVGGLTANFVSEGASIPESSLQFDAVSATLKKLAILARSSTELWEDSAPDLAEFVATEVGYAFAATEDNCGFNGDGTSTYSGISGLGAKLTGLKSAIAAASGHNTFLTLDDTDVANLMGGVLATAVPRARWYCSAVGFAQTLCRLAGVSGGLVSRLQPDGTIEATYLGFPVEFSSKLPNSTSSLGGQPMLYFGDLRQSSLIVEQRAGTIVATSFDRYFDEDQVLVRGTRREDIINHDVGDAGTYGPIAMLVGTN